MSRGQQRWKTTFAEVFVLYGVGQAQIFSETSRFTLLFSLFFVMPL